jgi:EAL domain-containing protein (putative c-di-GMP-specific phosphodiesterase class I)
LISDNNLIFQNIKLIPYFQPIVSISSGTIRGMEVLARGITKDGEIISPAGLFKKDDIKHNKFISQKVRELALKQYAESRQTCSLFLNIFPSHFLFINDVKQDSHIWKYCKNFDINPCKVVIEVTEKAADEFEKIAYILNDYAKLGFKIAIDDWGSGHSNFDRLSILKPSLVKIDASFLWNAVSDPATAEAFCLASSMISRMGIEVIIEGIENVEHLNMSLDAECSLAQGFFFEKPSPYFPDSKSFAERFNSALSNYCESKILHIKNRKKK